MTPYTPVYTTEANVEALTQISIDTGTVPTSTQVLDWIEEIERRIVEQALGSHAATDEYVDVPNQEDIGAYWTLEWTPKVDSLRFKYSGAGELVPLYNVKKPILSITSLYKNDEALDDAPSWTQLTEGPANNSSFILLKSGIKGLGYALFFYDNYPSAGPKRLKVTYTYGWNVDSKILRDYCTLGVSVKVLEARMGTSSGDGLSEFQSGDFSTYIPTQYMNRIKLYKEEMKEIETKYFPKPDLPAAFF